MKSYGHLWEKLVSPDNIRLAIEEAAKNKEHKWKRRDIRFALSHKAEIVKRVIWLLENEYVPPDPTRKRIYEPIAAKYRVVAVPAFMYEQIIQHSIVQVLGPLILPSFYEYSSASIPGRGQESLADYIHKFMMAHPEKCKYCVMIDIHHCYQSVPIKELEKLIKRKIRDERFRRLLNAEAEACPDHVINGEKYGIAAGFYISPWLLNWYLTPVDHHIKEHLHIPCYGRFMDNFILFSPNKRKLRKDMMELFGMLGEYGFTVNKNYQLFRTRSRPPDFVGRRFYFDRMTLRKRTLNRIRAKANRISKKEKVTWYDAQQMLSKLGRMRHTDTYQYYLKYIKAKINVKKLKKKVSRRSQYENRVHPCMRITDGGSGSDRHGIVSGVHISPEKYRQSGRNGHSPGAL